MKTPPRVLLAVLLLGLLTAPSGAVTNQVVFFNGFLANTSPTTGLGRLNTTLATLGIPGYEGKLFEWTQRQQAFDWVQQFQADRATLVLIGHSFGGNSAFELANTFLQSAGLTADLVVQIDPVNYDAAARHVKPSNVDVALNYYQISTSLFEPQGANFVAGATNINVEVLFDDPSITHTSIDNDVRLHALIGQNIFDNLNPASSDFDQDGDVDGGDFLVWQRDLSVGSLASWQDNYGGVPLAATAAVPEPATWVLVGMPLLLLSRWQTRLRGMALVSTVLSEQRGLFPDRVAVRLG